MIKPLCDCNDQSNSIHPKSEDICNDVDDDCSGEIDDNSEHWKFAYPDFDRDGYGDRSHEYFGCKLPEGYVEAHLLTRPTNPNILVHDCDDHNPEVHPEKEQICGNHIDENCAAPYSICDLTSGTLSNTPTNFNIKKIDRGIGTNSHYFSLKVWPAGDLNNDGLKDIAIRFTTKIANHPPTHPDYRVTTTTGIHIYLSPFSPNQETYLPPDVSFMADESEGLGTSFISLGDINGDGFNDIAIGAPGNSEAAIAAGAVYVYLGPFGRSHPLKLAAKFLGEGYGSQAGTTLDGNPNEIMIGASGYGFTHIPPNSYHSRGATYIVDTSTRGTVSLAQGKWKITGSDEKETLGTSISLGCDLTGDGIKDYAIGAPNTTYVTGEYIDGVGEIHVFPGPLSGTPNKLSSEAPIKVKGTNDRFGVGQKFRCLGDVNGDSYDDMAIPHYESSKNVTAFMKGPILTTRDITQADVRVVSRKNVLLNEVGNAGDINGDGRPDVYHVANFGTIDQPERGDINLFTNIFEPLFNNDYGRGDYRYIGENEGDRVRTAAGVGDTNGDGYDDILVGVPAHERITYPTTDRMLDSGAAYLIFGRSY